MKYLTFLVVVLLLWPGVGWGEESCKIIECIGHKNDTRNIPNLCANAEIKCGNEDSFWSYPVNDTVENYVIIGEIRYMKPSPQLPEKLNCEALFCEKLYSDNYDCQNCQYLFCDKLNQLIEYLKKHEK